MTNFKHESIVNSSFFFISAGVFLTRLALEMYSALLLTPSPCPQLCLPKGLQVRTQKQCLDAVYHPFLITREDGSRCYGFAYTFYEEVNCQRVCTALHALQVSVLFSKGVKFCSSFFIHKNIGCVWNRRTFNFPVKSYCFGHTSFANYN